MLRSRLKILCTTITVHRRVVSGVPLNLSTVLRLTRSNALYDSMTNKTELNPVKYSCIRHVLLIALRESLRILLVSPPFPSFPT